MGGGFSGEELRGSFMGGSTYGSGGSSSSSTSSQKRGAGRGKRVRPASAPGPGARRNSSESSNQDQDFKPISPSINPMLEGLMGSLQAGNVRREARREVEEAAAAKERRLDREATAAAAEAAAAATAEDRRLNREAMAAASTAAAANQAMFMQALTLIATALAQRPAGPP